MTKYKPIPEFSQFVEYITQGELVDGEYQVVVNRVPLPEQPIVEAAETLKAAYEHASTLGRLPTIEGDELDRTKAKLAESYHEDIVTEATKTTNPINITGTVAEVKSYLNWKANEVVTAGVIRFFGNNLYKCIQPHTTQADWTPDLTPALWKRYFEPDDYQEWVQPTGAHDAYNTGNKVIFEGHLWESLIDANVWSPAVYPAGWKDLGIYP